MNSILFGTDGIRGKANKYPMDSETAIKIGKAIAYYLHDNNKYKKIIIAKDTRISGDMLVTALCSGICSMGVDVIFAQILPTPGVAWLTRKNKFCAGIVVSASHNEFYDNGIKIFKHNGCKISLSDEIKLDKLIKSDSLKSKKITHPGTLSFYPSSTDEYNIFLESCYFQNPSMKNIKIVLDCSNGATTPCAPVVFKALGANVISTFCSPNGFNINKNCGSEFPESLVKTVLNHKANIGLAFDGDGDRLVAVSELGQILTGDHLMAIIANDFKKHGTLKNNSVVSTIMSNSGFKIALEKLGIKHIETDVGDKNVATKMIESGSILGGENSGHIILSNYQKTGDAILTALNLIGIILRSGKSLSELLNIITIIPQYMTSIDVNFKVNISNVDIIQNAVLFVKKQLGEKSRIIIRYSGTKPKCRIMIEGTDSVKIKKYCHYLSDVVSNYLNSFYK